MVPAGNKAKVFLSVNHTTKTLPHHHHHHHHHHHQKVVDQNTSLERIRNLFREQGIIIFSTIFPYSLKLFQRLSLVSQVSLEEAWGREVLHQKTKGP